MTDATSTHMRACCWSHAPAGVAGRRSAAHAAFLRRLLGRLLSGLLLCHGV